MALKGTVKWDTRLRQASEGKMEPSMLLGTPSHTLVGGALEIYWLRVGRGHVLARLLFAFAPESQCPVSADRTSCWVVGAMAGIFLWIKMELILAIN